jgi:hypothetical protein
MNKIMSPFGGSPVGGKKLLWRAGLAAGTLGLVVAGAAAFSAFEAHVVNVTATISNATDVPTTPIVYGNVFPQEIQDQFVTMSLSQSFLSGANTLATNVDYVLKQKPKCGLPVAGTAGGPVTYSAYEQVTEKADGVFICPDANYVMLPLLCPYLSKTSHTQGDISIPAFHGPTALADWTNTVSIANQAVGHLSKGGTTSTTSTSWDIDLHTPCFKTECAQDWASFVTTANPSITNPATIAGYQAEQSLKGQQMGCDLWFEVSGINNNGAPAVER